MNKIDQVKVLKLTMAELLKSVNPEIQVNGEDAPDEVRDRILDYFKKAEILEIDLHSLRSMSPSFAYNAFGKLHDVVGESVLTRLEFVNDTRNLKSRIIDAIHRRQRIQAASSR